MLVEGGRVNSRSDSFEATWSRYSKEFDLYAQHINQIKKNYGISLTLTISFDTMSYIRILRELH